MKKVYWLAAGVFLNPSSEGLVIAGVEIANS
jgi:hypothetical protein